MELVCATAIHIMINYAVKRISYCVHDFLISTSRILERFGYVKWANFLLKYNYQVDYLVRICVFSGLGLGADIIIFSCLVYVFGVDVFVANILSVYIAATLIYVIFVKKLFCEFDFTTLKYCLYIFYQLIATIIFSYLLDMINDLVIHQAIVSKLLIVFVTVIINYIFFTVLMRLRI